MSETLHCTLLPIMTRMVTGLMTVHAKCVIPGPGSIVTIAAAIIAIKPAGPVPIVMIMTIIFTVRKEKASKKGQTRKGSSGNFV